MARSRIHGMQKLQGLRYVRLGGAAHKTQHLSNTGLCCAAELTLLAEYNVFYRTTADPPMPTSQSTLRMVELVRLSRNNSPNLRFPLPWIAACPEEAYAQYTI